jgi:hypothetical protein
MSVEIELRVAFTPLWWRRNTYGLTSVVPNEWFICALVHACLSELLQRIISSNSRSTSDSL